MTARPATMWLALATLVSCWAFQQLRPEAAPLEVTSDLAFRGEFSKLFVSGGWLVLRRDDCAGCFAELGSGTLALRSPRAHGQAGGVFQIASGLRMRSTGGQQLQYAHPGEGAGLLGRLGVAVGPHSSSAPYRRGTP